MSEITTTTPENETILLRPTNGWNALNLRDLWRYRELMYFLTWRDIKVRYKQTVLGVLWAIINPLVQMLVFSYIFGSLANLDSEGVPYTIFTFAALLPWQLFAKSLGESGRSMVSNKNMITKVYFPRLVIPISSLLAGLVDFAISFVIMIGMMIYYKITPTINILMLPVFILLVLITALGVGLWFSAMHVHYRDVGYVMPFLSEVWKYLTPVAYSAGYISAKWQTVYSLNPMAGVVEGFRWAILGTTPTATSGVSMLYSAGIAILILISGLFYFRRMERTFADTV